LVHIRRLVTWKSFSGRKLNVRAEYLLSLYNDVPETQLQRLAFPDYHSVTGATEQQV